VDFWLDSIVARFITKFVVDIVKSYTIAKHNFINVPRGRYIQSLYTSIKILFHDKGVMKMDLES
jgi:hypothetical protein